MGSALAGRPARARRLRPYRATGLLLSEPQTAPFRLDIYLLAGEGGAFRRGFRGSTRRSCFGTATMPPHIAPGKGPIAAGEGLRHRGTWKRRRVAVLACRRPDHLGRPGASHLCFTGSLQPDSVARDFVMTLSLSGSESLSLSLSLSLSFSESVSLSLSLSL